MVTGVSDMTSRNLLFSIFELTVFQKRQYCRAGRRGGMRRLSAARGFAFHLHATDPAAEIPPRHLIPARTSRATPSLYSAAEVAALMAATSRLRAAAYRALIGLLASTGMRVGEASALDHRRAVTSQVKDYGRVMGPRRSQIIHATLMYSGDLSPVHDMNSR